MVIHLTAESLPPRGVPPNGTRMRPIPETGPGVSSATGQATRRLCLALHRMGFIVPRKLPSGRWAFTPPFHPCRNARSSAARRSVFCDTFHRPELSSRPSAGFSAACCLVVFGLSSPAEAGATIYPPVTYPILFSCPSRKCNCGINCILDMRNMKDMKTDQRKGIYSFM